MLIRTHSSGRILRVVLRRSVLATAILGAVAITVWALAPTGAGSSAGASEGGALPQVTSTGATVQALWQSGPLIEPVVAGDLVLGLDLSHGPAELQAVSALTGRPMWSTALPSSEPDVLGLSAGGGVALVEVGHNVGRAPAAVIPTASELVVFDAHSGRQLWGVSVAHGAARWMQRQPIAYSQGLIVMGNTTGGVIARNARSGAVVWRARAAWCTQRTGRHRGYYDGLAADGRLLAVSYRCPTEREVVVQRLDPYTGVRLWQWISPTLPSRSSVTLSVTAAAARGGVVLLSGQMVPPPAARRYLQRLPRLRMWPTSLGPFGESELLLALDARSGRPRWSELGGQQETITLTDGVACETDTVGFECRDDRSGERSRPVLRTTRTEGDSPPYVGDGYAGISGTLAGVVLSQAPGGAITIAVLPLRGHGIVAHATVKLGSRTYGDATYSDFITGAGSLPDGTTLLLLRRVDVAGYPLIALSVSPT
jgi:outer membrane protein assembly factor BamB